MPINPYIFREYDIRGRIDKPDELSDANVYDLARAAAAFFQTQGISSAIVGHDARAYSAGIKDIVVRALRDSGINVTDIGQVLVPIFYHAQYQLHEKAGIMITASHNPNGWSGMKIANDFSRTILGDEIKEIARLAGAKEFVDGSGTYRTETTAIEEYTADIISRVNIERPLRVLIDAGNGTAGPIVPAIFRRAGCEVIERHCELDPTFPHHEPNPSALAAAEDISRGVLETGADIGFGFDDDGDRAGFVDNEGTIVWPDKALIFLARSVLAKYPGSSVVFDVKGTRALAEDIETHGGHAIIWKTGHSYIKQKSKEVDAPLAGERSGHIFFRKDYFGYDDAPFAALKFLEYLSQQKESFSELLKTIPQYVSSPVWEPSCPDDKKYGIVEQLVAEFKKEYGADKVLDINGARVDFEDGWGLVRASSNLPVLVLVFESKTQEGLKRIEQIFRDKLAKFPEVGSEWHSG